MSAPSETQSTEDRRLGDAIAIPGDYQHKALTEGPRIQRAWHLAKIELLDWFWTPAVGSKVLDVGCGSGVFSDALAKKGCSVVGVDANTRAVAYAKSAFGRPGVSFLEGYLDALDLPSNSFDGAVCLEVIEHVHMPQVQKLLADFRRLLKPGARLLLTTPNYRGVWPAVEWLTDRVGKTAKMDADQHVLHFHRRLFREAIQTAGFRAEKIRTYCTFAPFAAVLGMPVRRVFDRIERKIDLPFGNLLAGIAVNP